MSIKSPRQPVTKKPGRSIKEKRLIKKSRKAVAENDRMTVFLRGEPTPPATKAWPAGSLASRAHSAVPITAATGRGP